MSKRETPDTPWHAPHNLGPTINSASDELTGSISTDGLELYFASNRPGSDANGDFDIWVSKRASIQDDWPAPVNLGSPINSSTGATCLTQALSGQVLLARRRVPSHLHIGVAKSSTKKLNAHAWLECDGQIVLGDHGRLAAYVPFPTLE